MYQPNLSRYRPLARPFDHDEWPGLGHQSASLISPALELSSPPLRSLEPELEHEQSSLSGVKASLDWIRVRRPNPFPLGEPHEIWRQLWRETCDRQRARDPGILTKACVYIIAKPLAGGVAIVKVGETGIFAGLSSRKVSYGRLHRGRHYGDLVVRQGYTLFIAPVTLERKAGLQHLISRILLRVTEFTGHFGPRAVITSVGAETDVKNVLPLELAELAARSFDREGIVTVTRNTRLGPVTTSTRFVRYPVHLGRDILDGRRHIRLAVASDHAF